LGIFLAFEELGDFWGNFESTIGTYNGAFSVKYSKNMRISASQNMFLHIFHVIYHKIYTYIEEKLLHFWGILCIFGEF
jgi:hypothetical protein